MEREISLSTWHKRVNEKKGERFASAEWEEGREVAGETPVKREQGKFGKTTALTLWRVDVSRERIRS